MKNIYLVSFIMFSLSYSFSQSVEIFQTSDLTEDVSGTEIERIGADSDIAVYADLKVVNKTGAALNMAFKRLRLIDSGRNDQICDNQGCFNATDTYEWSTSPVEILDGDTSLFKPQIVPNGNDFCGVHKYYVIDDAGVAYDSITIKIRTSKVDCALSVDETKKAEIRIDFYPNPAKNKLMIESPRKGKIIFTDALGKQIENSEVQIGTNNIDISTMNSGVYFVSFVSSNGARTKPTKLIIQK